MPDSRETGGIRLQPVEGPEMAPFSTSGQGPLQIGRAEDADICLPDLSVSRHHASLVKRKSCWLVIDLDSRHGTYLNTIRLEPNEEVRLAGGDLLRVGMWTFLVIAQDEETDHEPVNYDAPEIANVESSRTSTADSYATRATIFIRLRDDKSDVRELSWQEFANRYSRVIVGFARNSGLPAHEADDVLQDVLLGFFRVSDRFEYDPSKGRFRGYLKRVTLNAMRMQHRRKRPEAGLDAEQVQHDETQSDVAWNNEWTRLVLSRAMEEASQKFEPQTWKAFELYGRRSVPYEEVAKQLGMSPESVRHAKSRVAKAVREAINRIRAEEG